MAPAHIGLVYSARPGPPAGCSLSSSRNIRIQTTAQNAGGYFNGSSALRLHPDEDEGIFTENYTNVTPHHVAQRWSDASSFLGVEAGPIAQTNQGGEGYWDNDGNSWWLAYHASPPGGFTTYYTNVYKNGSLTTTLAQSLVGYSPQAYLNQYTGRLWIHGTSAVVIADVPTPEPVTAKVVELNDAGTAVLNQWDTGLTGLVGIEHFHGVGHPDGGMYFVPEIGSGGGKVDYYGPKGAFTSSGGTNGHNYCCFVEPNGEIWMAPWTNYFGFLERIKVTSSGFVDVGLGCRGYLVFDGSARLTRSADRRVGGPCFTTYTWAQGSSADVAWYEVSY